MLSLGCTPVVYSGGGGYGYAPPPPHYGPRFTPTPYYGASYGYGYAPPHYAAPRPAAYYGASYGVHVGAGARHRGQYQQPCTPRYARPMR